MGTMVMQNLLWVLGKNLPAAEMQSGMQEYFKFYTLYTQEAVLLVLAVLPAKKKFFQGPYQRKAKVSWASYDTKDQ